MSPTIDLKKLNQKITKKLKLLCQFIYMVQLLILIKYEDYEKRNIYIDDCAQAHGAKDDRGQKVGSLADISTFGCIR